MAQEGVFAEMYCKEVAIGKAWLPWKQQESDSKEASPKEGGGHQRKRERKGGV